MEGSITKAQVLTENLFNVKIDDVIYKHPFERDDTFEDVKLVLRSNNSSNALNSQRYPSASDM